MTSLRWRGGTYRRTLGPPVSARLGLLAHHQLSRPRQDHRCSPHATAGRSKQQRADHTARQRPPKRRPPSPLPRRRGPHGVAIENGHRLSRTWSARANEQGFGLRRNRRSRTSRVDDDRALIVVPPTTSQQHRSPSLQKQRWEAEARRLGLQRRRQRRITTGRYNRNQIGA